MTSPLFHDYGSDEQRAVEGIAALLELNLNQLDVDDETLAWNMADWALLQGPRVRWDAMVQASRAMIAARNDGQRFNDMWETGSSVLKEYNRLYGASF